MQAASSDTLSTKDNVPNRSAPSVRRTAICPSVATTKVTTSEDARAKEFATNRRPSNCVETPGAPLNREWSASPTEPS